MAEHVCEKCYLKATLTAPQTLKGKLRAQLGLVGVLNKAINFNYYNGPYTVKPTFEEQTLETNNKLMSSDVTVESIYVGKVTNFTGGNTVYIGGII